MYGTQGDSLTCSVLKVNVEHLPTVSPETTTLSNESGLCCSQNQWCRVVLAVGPAAFPGYLTGGLDTESDLPKACRVDTSA